MVPRPLNYPLPLSTGPLSPGNDNMQNPAGGLLHVLRILCCSIPFDSIIQARIFIHIFNVYPGCFTLYGLRTIRPKDKSPQDNSPKRKLVLRQVDPAFRRQFARFRRQLAPFRRQLAPTLIGHLALITESSRDIYDNLYVSRCRDAARPSHSSS